MQGAGILSFLASKRVEYIHVSSDGFKSMIERNFTDVACDVVILPVILLLPVMLHALYNQTNLGEGCS